MIFIASRTVIEYPNVKIEWDYTYFVNFNLESKLSHVPITVVFVTFSSLWMTFLSKTMTFLRKNEDSIGKRKILQEKVGVFDVDFLESLPKLGNPVPSEKGAKFFRKLFFGFDDFSFENVNFSS